MTISAGMGGIDPADLTDIRLELHHAVQLLAAFGQTFVTARDDDSHRSMAWLPQQAGFASDWSATTPRLRLILQPAELRVSVWPERGDEDGDADQATQMESRSLLGDTLEDAYAWVESAVERAAPGLGPVKLGRPEYEMPTHAVWDGAVFSADAGPKLEELGRWYSSAARALDELATREPDAADVLCWPHHFDIATLILLDPDLGAAAGRSVGVGFSPGDGGIAQPYWYVNVYPRPENPKLPELPGGAYWHTEGWLGAVLTGEAIVAARDADEQDERIRTFLEAAVRAARALL